jgi:small subunit ribosomal protein S6
MRKNRKGHYVHLNLKADAAAINELERLERLSDDILRYLTVKVDELDEAPSVLMHARTSREERTRRHDDGRRGRDDDRPRDRDRDDRPRRDDASSAAPAVSAAPAADTDAAPDADTAPSS